MIKMNESAIRTGILITMINKSPVKLKFKDSKKFDPYFGEILEVNDTSFTIEYSECVDNVCFSEIDNIIN